MATAEVISATPGIQAYDDMVDELYLKPSTTESLRKTFCAMEDEEYLVALDDAEVRYDPEARAAIDPCTGVDTFLRMQGDRIFVTHPDTTFD